MPEPTLTVLGVFAHPDDEVFRCGGTLALLAHSGARVVVLTATRGEAGSCGDPPLCDRASLGTVREQELGCACTKLGIEPPRLLDYRDGTLADVDPDEGAAHIVRAVRELRPRAVLTWPAHGLSGHPDHAAVSRWTTLAFEQSHVLRQGSPAELLHLAVPHSIAQALGMTQLHATPDKEISVTVDVTSIWDQKLAAIHCHATQLSASPLLPAPLERQRLFLGTEHFVRAAIDQFQGSTLNGILAAHQR